MRACSAGTANVARDAAVVGAGVVVDAVARPAHRLVAKACTKEWKATLVRPTRVPSRRWISAIRVRHPSTARNGLLNQPRRRLRPNLRARHLHRLPHRHLHRRSDQPWCGHLREREALVVATAASGTSNAVPGTLPGRSRAGGLASLIGRVITAVLALAVMVAGFMFSMVLLVAGLVAGSALFLWIWWKMRRAVRQMPQHDAEGMAGAAPGHPQAGTGRVIEGEVLSGEWKEPRDPGKPAH
jgi:hypothetical protein